MAWWEGTLLYFPTDILQTYRPPECYVLTGVFEIFHYCASSFPPKHFLNQSWTDLSAGQISVEKLLKGADLSSFSSRMYVHTMWIENCVKKNRCKTSKTSWTETRNLVFYESDCAGLRCIVHGLNNPFVFWEQRRWGVWGSWCCNTAPSMLHIGTQCLFFLRYLRRSFLLPPKKL